MTASPTPTVQGVTAEVDAARKEFGRWTMRPDRSLPAGMQYLVLRADGDAFDVISEHALASKADAALSDLAWTAALEAAAQVRTEQDGGVERLQKQLDEERQRTHTMAYGRQDWRHAAEVAGARALKAEEANDRLQTEARFLVNRLNDLDDDCFTEDGILEFHGHVFPAMSRLRALLSDLKTETDRDGAIPKDWNEAIEAAAKVIEDDNTAGYGEHRNMAIASAVSEHHAKAIRALASENRGRDATPPSEGGREVGTSGREPATS